MGINQSIQYEIVVEGGTPHLTKYPKGDKTVTLK
jgi:hypothetical protein